MRLLAGNLRPGWFARHEKAPRPRPGSWLTSPCSSANRVAPARVDTPALLYRL